MVLQERLRELAQEAGRAWRVTVRHVERVKWYAPHIRHIVLDVLCEPELAAPPRCCTSFGYRASCCQPQLDLDACSPCQPTAVCC